MADYHLTHRVSWLTGPKRTKGHKLKKKKKNHVYRMRLERMPEIIMKCISQIKQKKRNKVIYLRNVSFIIAYKFLSLFSFLMHITLFFENTVIPPPNSLH